MEKCFKLIHIERLIVSLIFLTVLLNGCATMDMQTAKEDLKQYIKTCSSKYGYDPDSKNIEEDRLADGEKEWRSCIYEGINNLILPNTTIPEEYKELIAEDKRMTDAIEKGEMTRSDRKTRLLKLLENIRTLEEKEKAKRVLEMEQAMKQLDWQRQQLDSISRMSESRRIDILQSIAR